MGSDPPPVRGEFHGNDFFVNPSLSDLAKINKEHVTEYRKLVTISSRL